MERRRLLSATALAVAGIGAAPVLAACSNDTGTTAPNDSAPPAPSPGPTGADPRSAALALEAALLRHVADVRTRFAATAPDLAAVHAGHTAHLAALTSGAAEPSPTSDLPRIPGTARAALRQLARQERTAAATHAELAATADPGTARLLASLSAFAAAADAALTASSS